MIALVMVTAATITVPTLIFPVVAGHPWVVPAALVAIVSGSGFAVLFSRLLTGPLTQLTQAALALPHDEPGRWPISATGDIGILASAFARMAEEINSHSVTIENYADRERFYVAAVESSNYAFITSNSEGIITAWNPGADRLFGYSADEAIGQRMSLIIPQDRRGEARGNREKINRFERITNFETVRIAKDGRLIDVVLDGSPIRSRSGDVLGSAIIARDMTPEKLTQEMFRLAVESCPSGMVMFDRTNRIVLVNTEVERLFGYCRDELIGQPVRMLVPDGFAIEEPRGDDSTNSDATSAPERNGHELQFSPRSARNAALSAIRAPDRGAGPPEAHRDRPGCRSACRPAA